MGRMFAFHRRCLLFSVGVFSNIYTYHSTDLSTVASECPPSRTPRERSRRPPNASPSSPCCVDFSARAKQQRCENRVGNVAEASDGGGCSVPLLCAPCCVRYARVYLYVLFSSVPVRRTSRLFVTTTTQGCISELRMT